MQKQKQVRSREQNIHEANCRRPAVFLDRDGVLTEETGYVDSVEKLRIFPYAAESIRKIHEKGYYAIVITNQSGIARGLFTEAKLQEMNRYLQRYTGVDAVFYCPHHPEGAVEEYRIKCNCRKPAIGMFQNACRRFDIDMANSYMVGDRAGDIIAGQNAGVKTILVESGYGTARLEENVMPDYVVGDLRSVLGVL